MPADVDIEVWTGGIAGNPNNHISLGTASAIRLRSDDNPTTLDLNKPVKVPDAGSNYSYWVHVALRWSGTFSQISEIKHYIGGDETVDWGTGVTLYRGGTSSAGGVPEASYTPATGSQGTTGDEMTANHPYYGSKTDIETDTSGSPMAVDNGSYASGTTGPSKAVLLQAEVQDTASHGLKSAETLTFEWSEI